MVATRRATNKYAKSQFQLPAKDKSDLEQIDKPSALKPELNWYELKCLNYYLQKKCKDKHSQHLKRHLSHMRNTTIQP